MKIKKIDYKNGNVHKENVNWLLKLKAKTGIEYDARLKSKRLLENEKRMLN